GWQRRADGLPRISGACGANDPRRPGTLYASVHRMKPPGMEKPTGGIYRSTNGGRTWSEVWSGFGIDKVAVNPTRPSTIYAQGDHLLRSTNGGPTWTIAARARPAQTDPLTRLCTVGRTRPGQGSGMTPDAEGRPQRYLSRASAPTSRLRLGVPTCSRRPGRLACVSYSRRGSLG